MMGIKTRRGLAISWLVLGGLCLAFAACSKSEKATKATASDRPSVETSISGAETARLAKLDQNLNSLSAQARSEPRDHWDPQYIVETVGKDPQHLLQWVKDNTVWIPYRGILRGPAGVLMDRQGNSIDRAYLLAALLKAAGYSVQLVQGEMDAQKASEMLPGLVAHQATAYGSTAENSPLTEELRSTAAQFKENEADITQALDRTDAETDRMLATLDGRVADQTKRLLGTVQKSDQQEEWNSRFAAALAALQDHWWVQRQDSDVWVDMDLMSEDDSPLASASGALQLEDLDSAAPQQEIALRVITEQWADGALSEHTALEQIIRPAALLGKSVTLQFWPEKPEDAESGEAANDEELVDPRTWQALVFIDGQAVGGAELPDTGEDLNAPQKGGAFGGIAGAFGNTMNTNASPKGILSAVWLEYEIRTPGAEPRKVRRVVFDLVGPDARAKGAQNGFELSDAMRQERALALMMRTEILPLGSNVAPQFLAHLMAQSFLDNRTFVHGALTAGASVDSEELLGQAKPPVSSLYNLALAQQRNRDPRYSLIDRPLILTSHFYPKQQGQETTFVGATDIVANETGVSLAKSDAFAIRLEQGIRDTNAESLVKGGGPRNNAGDAFAQSSSWVTLTSADPEAVDHLKLPADVRRRIQSDLEAGYVVVAPKVPVSMKPDAFSGWWRVDPNTGNTLGFGEQGWGSEEGEYDTTNAPARASRVALAKIWGRKFLKEVATNFGFCAGINVVAGVRYAVGKADSFKTGVRQSAIAVKVSISDSAGRCLRDSVLIGALVTAPLLARTFSGGAAFAELPPPPEPPPEPPCDPLGETQADLGRTQPDLGKTQPNLGETQADLGKTQPNLGETQPDLGKTQPDLGKTQPDLQPDLNKTTPGLGPTNKTTPGLGPNEGPSVAEEGPAGSPSNEVEASSSESETPAGSKSADQKGTANGEKTGQQPSQAKTGGGNKKVVVRSSSRSRYDVPKDASPEVVQEAIEQAQSDLQAAKETLSAKRADLAEANTKYQKVAEINGDKTQEFVRYNAKRWSDPGNYDPDVADRLEMEADAAARESETALGMRRQASERMQDAHGEVLEIQQELKALQKRAGGGEACK